MEPLGAETISSKRHHAQEEATFALMGIQLGDGE